MQSLIQTNNVQRYVDSKVGKAWPISSLFLDPLPILAIRNQNTFNDHYTEEDWHSTFSWDKNSNLKYAIHVAIPLLSRWKALRTRRKGGQHRLETALKNEAPKILLRFQDQAKELGIRRLSDVKPNRKYYRDFLIAAANAVGGVSALKEVEAPMIGSKFMHFFLPEFFPVWDTAIIYKECLKYEEPPLLPDGVEDKIRTTSGKSYAQYVHLLITELSQINNTQRAEVLRLCIQQCAKDYTVPVNQMRNVLALHYDDLWATVLEICLIGKHR